MAKILTAAAIVKTKPGKHRSETPDGGCPGLFLIVQPTGAKSWALRFRRPNSKPAKLTLGTVYTADKEPDTAPAIGGHLTLAAARRLVAELRHEIAQDRDPAAAHLAEKRYRRTAVAEGAGSTFAAAARRFIDEYKHKKTSLKPRRRRETARLLGLNYPQDMSEPTMIKGGLAERWIDKPITEIAENDLFLVIDGAREQGVPGTQPRNKGASEPRARAMHSALSVLFGWLKAKRLISVDPSTGLEAPSAPAARERTLEGREIIRFWSATETVGEPFGVLLKLLLLTGGRLNEVARMSWDELSEDGSIWSLASARTKNRRAHVVPLPRLARNILGNVKRIEGRRYVFSTNGSTPVSGWSKIKKRLDVAMELSSPWRLHDLRRTAATGMAELGIAPHIVEAALNHVSGAKAGVAGTYNRAAYAPEKRAALERWAAHISGLVSGQASKVTPLRPRRGA